MSRRVLFFTVLAILALSAAACGVAAAPAAPTSQAPASPAATSAPAAALTKTPAAAASAQGAPVELTYLFRITTPASSTFQQWVADQFNEKYKGKIHVTIRSVDDETYKTKLVVELGSPTPPDVFFSWEGGRAKSVIDAGLAEPLDQYYKQYNWDKIFTPGALTLATFGGKKYFVPTEMGTAVVWYRPDIYKKYNLSVPKTWDELAANAETFKKNGIAPFILANQKAWPAQFEWTTLLVDTAGLDVYQQLLDNKIPWTDPRVVAAWTKLKEIVDKGYFYPAINSLDVAPAVVLFSQGKAAMWYQGAFMLGNFKGSRDTIPFPIDFFPFPQIGDRKPVMEVTAESTLMIHSKSPHKAEAAEFINFFVSPEVQKKKIVTDRPFAANTNTDLSVLSPLEQRLWKEMRNAGEVTFMHVDHAFTPAIANKFLDATQALVGGAMTPEQAAQMTEEEAVKVRGPVKP